MTFKGLELEEEGGGGGSPAGRLEGIIGGAIGGDGVATEWVVGGNEGEWLVWTGGSGRGGMVSSVVVTMLTAGIAAEGLVLAVGDVRASLRVLPRTAKRLEREG